MPTHEEITKTVFELIQREDTLPEYTTYSHREVDQTGTDANVTLPLVTVTDVSVDYLDVHNTDTVGYDTETVDDREYRTGTIYHAEYDQTISFDLWIVRESENNLEQCGRSIHQHLYQYTNSGPDKPFPDDLETGVTDDDVWRFVVPDAEQSLDEAQSPSVDKWSFTVIVSSYLETIIDQDTVENVTVSTFEQLQ